jgi:NADH:ubiquinone oxidoreductase subunit K
MLVTIFTVLVIKNLLVLRLIVVSLGACEGALGLSLLIRISRIKNKYFVNRFFVSKC